MSQQDNNPDFENDDYALAIDIASKKYHAVISSLPSNVIFKISEFRKNPPQTRMYETLKNKIIQEFSDSEQTKVTKLLRDIPLGDRKPSALLAEKRAKSANTQITD